MPLKNNCKVPQLPYLVEKGDKRRVLLRDVVKIKGRKKKNQVSLSLSSFRFFITSNILHRVGSENATLYKRERGFHSLRTYFRTLRFTRASLSDKIANTRDIKCLLTKLCIYDKSVRTLIDTLCYLFLAFHFERIKMIFGVCF